MSSCHWTRGWSLASLKLFFYLCGALQYSTVMLSIIITMKISIDETKRYQRHLFNRHFSLSNWLLIEKPFCYFFLFDFMVEYNFWPFLHFVRFFFHLVYQLIFLFLSRPKWLFSNDHDEQFCPLEEHQPISISAEKFQIWSCLSFSDR
jgi:hypothetical protein